MSSAQIPPVAWLRLLTTSMEPPLLGAALTRVRELAGQLQAEFKPSELTKETARLCGAKLTGEPDYPALAAALRSCVPAVVLPTTVMGTSAEAREADRWDAYAARSLGLGKPRAVILSMVRQHSNLSAHWVRQIMRNHFPAELAIEDALAAEKAAEREAPRRLPLVQDAKGDAYVQGAGRGFKPPRPPSSNCFRPEPGDPIRPVFRDVTHPPEILAALRRPPRKA